MHLDHARYQQLLAGDPELIAFFAEHLAEPCDACEEFLARVDAPPTLLDGAADHALFGWREAAAEPRLDEVAFSRLQRTMRAPRSRAARFLAPAVAIAAALLVVVVARTQEGDDAQGIKGAGPIALELSVAARGPDGAVRPLAPDARVPADHVLFLRYRSSEAAAALLMEVPEKDATRARALAEVQLQPGAHDVRAGASIAQLDVQDERGGYGLYLVARRGSEPPSERDARAVIAGGSVEGVSVASFPLTIEAPRR